MENCWEIKHCNFEGTDYKVAACPVYKKQCSCWEFDWSMFWKAMADGPDKESGKKAMLQECSSCAVRQAHPKEVNRFMTLIEKLE